MRLKRYEKKFLSLDRGETISYIEAGLDESADIMILVHGNYSDSTLFSPLIEKLETKCKVYAIDLRGMGDSTYNKKATSARAYSKDIVDFIYKKKIKNALLLGWSFGGGVCLEAGADLGDLIRGIILLSPMHADGFKMPFMQPFTFSKYARAIFPMQMSLLDSFNIFQEIKSLMPDRQMAESFFKELMFNAKEVDEEYMEICLDALYKQRNNIDMAEALCSFNISREDGAYKASRRINYIKVPIVQFHGHKDVLVPFYEVRDKVKLLGKKTRLIEFENSGHCIINDELDKLLVEIRNFILATKTKNRAYI